MDEMDRMLAQLGTRDGHPGLAGMDDAVIAGIARHRGRARGMGLGVAVTMTALMAGVMGSGASVAMAGQRSPQALSALGSSDGLAPSTLLATAE